MRFFNATHIPDDLLESLILLGAKRAGANLSGITVEVVLAQGYSQTGSFFPSNSRIRLRPRLPLPTSREKSYIKRSADYAERFRAWLTKRNMLGWAEGLYSVIVHEFTHLADKQEGLSFSHSKSYRKRPHEIRAYAAGKDSYEDREGAEETAILEYACYLEGLQK